VKLRHKGEVEINLALAAQINKLRFGYVKGRRASDRNSVVRRRDNIWCCKTFRDAAFYKTQFAYVNPLTYELNPSAQRGLTRFLPWTLLLKPCISLIYV
jgi:hypothetical protein